MGDFSADTLEIALHERLREVVGAAPATEADLRDLAEQGRMRAELLAALIDAGERWLQVLDADPASSLSEIAAGLRELEQLRSERDCLIALLACLDERARELRAEWLSRQGRRRPD
jgi:hypothetical protein